MREILFLTLLSLTVYGQNQLHTSKYAGTYTYTKEKNGAMGTILVHPETDTTILFYVEVFGSGPAHNTGSLYGRLKLINGQWTYKSKDEHCQFAIQFSKDKLAIKTIKQFNDCDFGNGTFVDGEFFQTIKKTPEYFEDVEGTKYLFKTTDPDKFNNE